MTALIIVHWILVGTMVLIGCLGLLVFVAFAFFGPKDERHYDWWALGMTFFAWIVPACHLIPGFW